jgi:hypothetical protein
VLLQAYSASKDKRQTERLGNTRCITNIHKNWNLHYM